MYGTLFNEFLACDDTLRVYSGEKLVFISRKDRLSPLIDYIRKFGNSHKQVIIFDKIMGNAAALLSIKAGCQEVFSPLGSHLAVNTLQKYNIKCHFIATVPYITTSDGNICPMEQLSICKEPEEFYMLINK